MLLLLWSSLFLLSLTFSFSVSFYLIHGICEGFSASWLSCPPVFQLLSLFLLLDQSTNCIVYACGLPLPYMRVSHLRCGTRWGFEFQLLGIQKLLTVEGVREFVVYISREWSLCTFRATNPNLLHFAIANGWNININSYWLSEREYEFMIQCSCSLTLFRHTVCTVHVYYILYICLLKFVYVFVCVFIWTVWCGRAPGGRTNVMENEARAQRKTAVR